MALPLPKVVPDAPAGGYIMGAMNNVNALTKGNLENQYYGPMKNAEMASKNAYAQWLPAQLMAQAISGPGFTTLSGDQQNALINRYHQALNNPPPQNTTPSSGGFLSALNNALLPSQQGTASASASNQGNSPNSLMGGAPEQPDQSMPAQQGADPQRSSTAIPTSTTGNMANQSGGHGVSAISTGKAQANYTESLGSAEGTQFNKDWTDSNSAAVNNSQVAQDVIDGVRSLKEIYPKIPEKEKGNIFGVLPADTLPARSEEAKKFDNTVNKVLMNGAQQLKANGVITGRDFDVVAGSKPSRRLGPESFQYISDFMRGAAERSKEKINANNLGKSLGLTSAQNDQLWSEYIHDMPFWNAKKGMINENNMGNFGHYYTPENVEKVRNPKAEMYMKSPEGKIEDTRTIGGKQYAKIKGSWHEVTQ